MKLHTKLDAISDRDRPEVTDPYADAAYLLPGKTVRVAGRVGRVESATRGGDAQVDFGEVIELASGGTSRLTERIDLVRLEVQIDLDPGSPGSWVPLFEDT